MNRLHPPAGGRGGCPGPVRKGGCRSCLCACTRVHPRLRVQGGLCRPRVSSSAAAVRASQVQPHGQDRRSLGHRGHRSCRGPCVVAEGSGLQHGPGVSCSWTKFPDCLFYLPRASGARSHGRGVRVKLLLRPRVRGPNAMGKCHQVGVGLGVDACAAALVCILHGGVPRRLGLRTLRTWAGESTRACVHTRVLVLACAPEHVCARGHVRAPAACPRSLPDVSARVHARAGAGGVLGHAHAHVGGCPHMQPCTLHLPGGLCTPGPCASALPGNDSRARRGSRDSVLDSCLSPPPGRPAIAATWSLRDPSRGRRGGTRPGAGCPGSPSGCRERGWGRRAPAGERGVPARPRGTFRCAGGGSPGRSGWRRARPDSRPSWALGSGSGTFPGGVSGGASCAQPWLNPKCHPRAAVPGAVLSSCPGRLPSVRGAPAEPLPLGACRGPVVAVCLVLGIAHPDAQAPATPSVLPAGSCSPSWPSPTVGDLPAADPLLPWSNMPVPLGGL